MPTTEKEIWKAIEGLEDIYEVSNFGRIKSLKRKGVRKDRILRQRSSGEHITIFLSMGDNVGYTFAAHRIVASHFVKNPKPDEYEEVHHRDGDRANNRADNLEWASSSQRAAKFIASVKCKRRSERKGVYKFKTDNGLSYRVVMRIGDGKTKYLGAFKTEEEAYKVYYDKWIELRGYPPW